MSKLAGIERSVAALHRRAEDDEPRVEDRAHAMLAEKAMLMRKGKAVADLWDQLSDGARLAYGSDPAPGQPLPDALAYREVPDPDAFVVLDLAVEEMDVLYLGPQHRRARFTRADGWAGGWCAP